MIDGMPLVDADTPVTIHITQADCERGSKKDPQKCAAALALKRDTSCDEPRVHLGCTYLRFGDRWLRYATPPSLKAEIISFDRGGGFYPGDFRLCPMPKALRLRPAKAHHNKSNEEAIKAKSSQTEAGTAKKTEPSNSGKRIKAKTRVFHRVMGVRERANSSKLGAD
jgi:hypothetical protein